jgi:hypothetical protein
LKQQRNTCFLKLQSFILKFEKCVNDDLKILYKITPLKNAWGHGVVWDMLKFIRKSSIFGLMSMQFYIKWWFENNLLDRFSERYAARKSKNDVYKRRFNHELDKEFNSPIALNVTKTSRLRYVGHMIRWPEELPQKALFSNGIPWKEKSRKTEIQVFGWGEQR